MERERESFYVTYCCNIKMGFVVRKRRKRSTYVRIQTYHVLYMNHKYVYVRKIKLFSDTYVNSNTYIFGPGLRTRVLTLILTD